MPAVTQSRYLVQQEWDDVPHLDEKTKRELLDSTPPHLREARSKGIPTLGSGAIYPIPYSEIECEPFAIPPYWKRAYALDVGWNKTAAMWGAQDPIDRTIYLYTEHYRGHEKPPIHAEAIKARGAWIKGAIDPASRGRGQGDGEQLVEQYRDLGLDLVFADNAVEAGIYKVWELLAAGRLKAFSTLGNFKKEYRYYQRDDKGRIVKKDDHLMDALRYLINTWDRIASVQAPERIRPQSFVAADSRAGY